MCKFKRRICEMLLGYNGSHSIWHFHWSTFLIMHQIHSHWDCTLALHISLGIHPAHVGYIQYWQKDMFTSHMTPLMGVQSSHGQCTYHYRRYSPTPLGYIQYNRIRLQSHMYPCMATEYFQFTVPPFTPVFTNHMWKWTRNWNNPVRLSLQTKNIYRFIAGVESGIL